MGLTPSNRHRYSVLLAADRHHQDPRHFGLEATRAARPGTPIRGDPVSETALLANKVASARAGVVPAIDPSAVNELRNRTGRFPASGSRTRLHAFTHGTSCPSRHRRTSPKTTYVRREFFCPCRFRGKGGTAGPRSAASCRRFAASNLAKVEIIAGRHASDIAPEIVVAFSGGPQWRIEVPTQRAGNEGKPSTPVGSLPIKNGLVLRNSAIAVIDRVPSAMMSATSSADSEAADSPGTTLCDIRELGQWAARYSRPRPTLCLRWTAWHKL
jgi:hypothetical protein